MKTLQTFSALTLLALGSATLQASDAPPEGAVKPAARPEASIPFMDMSHSVHDWQADKRDGIWVQDSRRQWYYGKFMSPCFGLDFALGVAFDTRHGSTLDRFAYVIVPGEHQRCALTSFTKSEPPPPEKRRGKKGKVVAPDATTAAPAEPPKAP
jgi:Family of unknown function (DUF6491)